jgi:replicative DNA helicase
MSPDIKIISKIVESGDILQAFQNGISGDIIEGAERDIWAFMESHYREFKKVPSKDAIQTKFSVELPTAADSIEFYAKEITDRKLHRDLVELSYRVDKKLTESNPSEALQSLQEFVRHQVGLISRKRGVSTLGDMMAEVKQRYVDAKDGKRGILTPWNRMDEWTMGWWPGDTSWFSARLGVGKTFVATMVTAAALKRDNCKVLFVSGEMMKVDIAMRLAAIQYQFPYGAVRKGRLGFPSEDKYFQALEELTTETGVEIMDASLGFKSSDLESAMERTEARLVVVDAAYRIKANQKTKDRSENMAIVSDDLKSFAIQYNKSIVCTTQLNRESTKKKSYGDEDVALSDVVGWNATNLFALKQEDEDRENKIMHIVPLKVREGENARESIELNWDMQKMDFSEREKQSFVPKASPPTGEEKDSWL